MNYKLPDYDMNYGSALDRSLANIKVGPNAMNEWGKVASEDVVNTLELALSHFRTWFNITYSPIRVLNLGTPNDWHKITRKSILLYKDYLISESCTIGVINERIAAIRVGARLAAHSGAITQVDFEQIKLVTGLYFPK